MNPENTSGWELVFSDEFNSAQLNTDVWSDQYYYADTDENSNPDTYGSTSEGNQELQWYTSDSLKFVNGKLKLEASKTQVLGHEIGIADTGYRYHGRSKTYDYKAGMISGHDKRAFTYGYMEMRAKVPAGQGLWSAFWMLPVAKVTSKGPDNKGIAHRKWPPEIDVFEIVTANDFGQDTTSVTTTFHYPDSTQPYNDGRYAGNYSSSGVDFSTGFHKFAVEWSPSTVIWYVDDVEVQRTPSNLAAYVPKEPMYLLANLVVGGNFGGTGWPGYPDPDVPFPTKSVDIDYIRVYQNATGILHGGAGNDELSRQNGNLAGSAGNDVLTVSGTGSIDGGDGNDLIQGGTGNNALKGGAGNDTIVGGGGSDNANGGAGIDTLILDLSSRTTGINIVNYRTSGISIPTTMLATNFENFEIVTGGGNDTVTQAGLVNSAVIRGDDGLKTGAGNDTINPGLGKVDYVHGGTGNDLLILDYSAGDTGQGVSLSLDSSTNTNGIAFRATATGGRLDYLDFFSIERFQFIGTSKEDSIATGAGNDTINSKAGNDVLVGGSGNDTLTGGTGSDRFTFNSSTEGIDRITDFNISQSDLIVVSASGFGGGLTAGSSITVDQFALGTAAADANDRFIYDAATGALRFDVDGTGATAAVQIATLSNKPTLSNTHITVIA